MYWTISSGLSRNLFQTSSMAMTTLSCSASGMSLRICACERFHNLKAGVPDELEPVGIAQVAGHHVEDQPFLDRRRAGLCQGAGGESRNARRQRGLHKVTTRCAHTHTSAQPVEIETCIPDFL